MCHEMSGTQNMSVGPMDNYLGDRVNVVATYETIKDGEDLSKLRKMSFSLNEQNESSTTLFVTMNALLNDLDDSHFGLNIHKSDTEPAIYYACGNVPEKPSTFAIEGNEDLD